MDDVYWAEEGRSSIDAAVISAGLMLLVLLGARPFEFPTGSVAEVIGATIMAAILLSLVTACFAKQRVLHGALGLFLWPIALYGAARVAKPGSPWAKRFYADRNPGKQNEGRETLRPRPAHRALQGTLSRQDRRHDQRRLPGKAGRQTRGRRGPAIGRSASDLPCSP